MSAFRFCPRCAAGLVPKQLKAGEPPRLVCTGCGFVFYLNPKLAACTIFSVDGGVVLARRAIEPQRGKWVFPGGFVDRGEPVPVAACRETWEEVNLTVEVVDLIGVYSYTGDEVAVVVYAARVMGGDLRANDECLEVAVFPPEQIPWDELAFTSTRQALQEYLRRFVPAGVGA